MKTNIKRDLSNMPESMFITKDLCTNTESLEEMEKERRNNLIPERIALTNKLNYLKNSKMKFKISFDTKIWLYVIVYLILTISLIIISGICN